MQQLQARGQPVTPPALVSDGQGGYREALLATWGTVPAYRGTRRRPTRRQAGPTWQYLQRIKVRVHGRVVQVYSKVVYGEPAVVLPLASPGTCYVERTNLTARQMTGRLVRKTLSFSKRWAPLAAAITWEDAVYNLVRPLKTLRREAEGGRRRWLPRTPMMAAGRTDHPWTIEELVTTVVVPDPDQQE